MRESENPPEIVVDISSASRRRIAGVVQALLEIDGDFLLDFAYAQPAFYNAVESWSSDVIVSAGPVLPIFGGVAEEPGLPIHAIVGLGYEAASALGAVQHLDASTVWTLNAECAKSDFSQEVDRVNSILLELVPPAQRLRYPIDDGFEIFDLLNRVTRQVVRHNANPVLVPLGPKIFAVAALLVSLLGHFDVPVFRFSGEQLGAVRDSQASGVISLLRVMRRGGIYDV